MWTGSKLDSLASESVQSASLPLQGVHHIEGGDCLATSVLCVGDGIPDDVLKEHLQQDIKDDECKLEDLNG